MVLSSTENARRPLLARIADARRKAVVSAFRDWHGTPRYLERPYLRTHLLDFLQSSARILVITGRAGTGKSTYVLGLTQDDEAPLTEQSVHTWIFDPTQTSPETLQNRALDATIARSLDLSGTLSTALEAEPLRPNQHLLLIFDGINFYPGAEILLQQVSSFARAITAPNVSIMLTCRAPTWNNLRRHLRVPPKLLYRGDQYEQSITLEPFTHEEAALAYREYALAYELKTPFNHLDPATQQLLTHPLFMKMAARAYHRQVIPPALPMTRVFSRFIDTCVGETHQSGPSYALLRSIIIQMTRSGRPFIKKAEIATIRNSLSEAPRPSEDPYALLLSNGLLVERHYAHSFHEETVTEVVHERILEYLIALFVLHDITQKQIIEQLATARLKSFTQLKGALELALSLALLNNSFELQNIVELACHGSYGSRQLILEAMRTVHYSGHTALVNDTIQLLTRQDSYHAKTLAVQLAHNLQLDDDLSDLALRQDSTLRNHAALYIYRRWNKLRIGGNLEAGYQIIRKVCRPFSILAAPSYRKSLSALTSISLNMGVHIIDDPQSLPPLADIWRMLIGSFPTVAPTHGNASLKGRISNVIRPLIIDTILRVVVPRVNDSQLFLRDIFTNHSAKRALLDIGSLATITDLQKHEGTVLALIMHPHPAVSFSTKAALARQVLQRPTPTISLLNKWFWHYNLPIEARFNILYGVVFGLVTGLTSNTVNVAPFLKEASLAFEAIWHDALSISDDDYSTRPGTSIPRGKLLYALQHVLFGLLFIEARTSEIAGHCSPSGLIASLNDADMESPGAKRHLLAAIRQIGYQGFVQFAALTLAERNFRSSWNSSIYMDVVAAIASLRVLYPEEVDDILDQDTQDSNLIRDVRSSDKLPEPDELRDMCYHWILVGAASNSFLLKLSGRLLMEVVLAADTDDFQQRVAYAMLDTLFDPKDLDIMHIEYGLAHDPNWDNGAELEISETTISEVKQEPSPYREIFQGLIADYGKGGFHRSDEQ